MRQTRKQPVACSCKSETLLYIHATPRLVRCSSRDFVQFSLEASVFETNRIELLNMYLKLRSVCGKPMVSDSPNTSQLFSAHPPPNASFPGRARRRCKIKTYGGTLVFIIKLEKLITWHSRCFQQLAHVKYLGSCTVYRTSHRSLCKNCKAPIPIIWFLAQWGLPSFSLRVFLTYIIQTRSISAFSFL